MAVSSPSKQNSFTAIPFKLNISAFGSDAVGDSVVISAYHSESGSPKLLKVDIIMTFLEFQTSIANLNASYSSKIGTNNVSNIERILVGKEFDFIVSDTYFDRNTATQVKCRSFTSIPNKDSFTDYIGNAKFLPISLPATKDKTTCVIAGIEFNGTIANFSSSSNIQTPSVDVIRGNQRVLKDSGHRSEQFTMTLMSDETSLVTNQLFQIVRSLNAYPITTCIGGPFGAYEEVGEIPTKDIAITNITIATVPNFPSRYQAVISFQPFVWDCYLTLPKDDKDMDMNNFNDFFCWPLLKLWINATQLTVFTDFQRFGEDHGFALFNVTNSRLENFVKIQNKLRNIVNENAITYTGVLSLLKGGSSGSTQTKKLVFSKESLVVFKVDNKEEWEYWLNVGLTDKSVRGLVDWTYIQGYNFTENGVTLNQSSEVPESYITSRFSQFNENVKTQDSSVDIPNGFIEVIPPKVSGRFAKFDPDKGFVVSGDKTLIEKIRKNLSNRIDKLSIPPSPDSLIDVVGKSQVQEKIRKKPVKYEDFTRKTSFEERAPILSVGFLDGQKDIIISSIVTNKQHNNIAKMVSEIALPKHEYLGSTSGMVSISGTVSSLEGESLIRGIQESFFSKMTKPFKYRSAGDRPEVHPNCVYVNCLLLNLVGINFLTPISLNINTVDGLPGVKSFEFTFMEYNPEIADMEKIKPISTTLANMNKVLDYNTNNNSNDGVDPLVENAIEWFSLNHEISKEDLYPDLRLPYKSSVYTWINALGDIARNDLKIANEFQQSVWNVCKDFYKSEENVKRFKQFHAPSIEELTSNDQKSVDPDFFIWYQDDERWEKLVRDLVSQSMGAIDDKTGSIKFSVGDKDKPGNETVAHDTITGVSTVMPAGSCTANISAIQNTASELIDNYPKHSYPTQAAQEHHDAYKKTQEELDSHPGAWWVPRFTTQEGTTRFNFNIPTSQFLDTESQRKDYQNVEPDLNNWDEIFYNPYWRLYLTEELCNEYGGKIPGNSAYKTLTLIPSGKFAMNSPKYPTTELEEIKNYYNTIIRSLSSSAKLEKPNFKNLVKFLAILPREVPNGSFDSIKNNYLVPWGIIGQSTLGPGDTVTSMGLTFDVGNQLDGSRDITNTTVNESFILESINWKSAFNGNTSDNLTIQNSGIGKIAIKYGIDPNLLVGVITTHRTFDATQGSDFSKALSLDPNINDLSFDDKIEYVAKVIAYYTKQKGLTVSVALMAVWSTLIVDRHTIRNEYPKLDQPTINNVQIPKLYKEFEDFLNGVSNTVKELMSFGKREEALAKIQEAVNGKYKFYGLDFYYETYIESSRSIGVLPAIFTSTDPLFSYKNLLIYTENQKSVDGRVVALSSVTPSGQSGSFNMSREFKIEEGRLGGIEDYIGQDKNGSIEFFAQSDKRYKQALQPGSEDSVFKCLDDLRQHGKFGRLVKAFPSYCIIIINEGWYWMGSSRKLWDQFYLRQSVSSIEVIKSRMNPTETCTIVFSNVFGNLTNNTIYDNLVRELVNIDADRKRGIVEGLLTGSRQTQPYNYGSDYPGLNKKNLTDDQKKKNENFNKHREELKAESKRIGYEKFKNTAGGKELADINSKYSDAPIDLTATKLDFDRKGAFDAIVQAYKDFWQANILKDVPDSIRERWKSSQTDQINIQPGARIQVRLGFGADASQLPIVFTGPVVQVENGEALIQVICQSDGAELEKQPADAELGADSSFLYSANGFLGQGKSPANMITEALVGPNILGTLTNGFFRDWSKASTSHFGNLVYYTSGTVRVSSIDYQINIYDSSTTKLEQGIPTVKNFFNYNALYNFDNENYFSLKVKQPTTWKVIECCRKACLDFVARPMPFATRSTLFFGKFWWPYNYDYDSSILSLVNKSRTTTSADGKTISTEKVDTIEVTTSELDTTNYNPELRSKAKLPSNFTSTTKTYTKKKALRPDGTVDAVMDIQNQAGGKLSEFEVRDYVQYLKWKPFMQAYPIFSGMNLYDNNIKADATQVATDMVGVSTYNGFLTRETISRTNVWSVDSDIIPPARKTAFVDTGIMTTFVQDPKKAIAGAAVNLIPGLNWMPGLSDYVKETPTTPAVQNSVVNSLADSVKQMYQGWMTIEMMPSMKPHDLLYIHDNVKQVSGPVFVKEVIHSLSLETGAVTFVSPDCIALPNSSVVGREIISQLSLNFFAPLGQLVAGQATIGVTKKLFKSLNKIKKVGTEVLADWYMGTESRQWYHVLGEEAPIKKAIDELEELNRQTRVVQQALGRTEHEIAIAINLEKEQFILRVSKEKWFKDLMKRIKADSFLQKIMPTLSTDAAAAAKLLQESITAENIAKVSANGNLRRQTAREISLFADKMLRKQAEARLAAELAVNATTEAEEIAKAAKVAQASAALREEAKAIRIIKKLESEAKGVLEMYKGTSGIMNHLKLTSKYLKTAKTIIQTGPYATPVTAVINIAVQVLFSSLIDAVNARLAARQCITIIPLVRHNGAFFEAGITGHQGAVIFDQSGGALDLFYDKYLSIEKGITIPGVLSTLIGIEPNQFANHQVNTQWRAFIDTQKKNSSLIRDMAPFYNSSSKSTSTEKMTEKDWQEISEPDYPSNTTGASEFIDPMDDYGSPSNE